jgi:hypothetical protein
VNFDFYSSKFLTKVLIMNFNKSVLVNFSIQLLTISLLVGCGGSGGSSGASSSSSTATAAFTGPISGIGSIVVNGIRFETVGVSVADSDDIYGTTSFNSSLALGMTVALGGDVDETASTGTPSKIRVVGGVRGKVSALTGTTISTLNGQTVNVDSNTVYAGLRTTFASIAVNDYVEIYGVTQTNGDFLATRVVSSSSLTQTNKLAIRGTIDSIPSATTYVVRTSSTATVTVACDPSATPACSLRPSGATLTAASGSTAGTPVRVVASDTTSLSVGVLTAVKVQSLSPEQLTAFSGVNASYSKIKGYTSQIGSDWYVGGVKVTGYSFTSVGQFVEVKGTWSGTVLQALKVETENDRTTGGTAYKNEFYGAVSGKNGNTFVVQGITVDASAATFSGGTLAGLANGDYVEVKGSLNNGSLTAVKVEVKNTSNASSSGAFAGAKFEVYGTVSSWTAVGNTFTLTALNSAGGVYTALASSATIAGTVANGSVVEAKGYLDGNQQFVITKLEVKDPNFRD